MVPYVGKFKHGSLISSVTCLAPVVTSNASKFYVTWVFFTTYLRNLLTTNGDCRSCAGGI
jgi:hypothetical protein